MCPAVLDSGHADIKNTFSVPKKAVLVAVVLMGLRSVLGKVLS